MKKAADAGKCFDTAMKEVKLPKYEKWNNYETGLPANVERFCYWWVGVSTRRAHRRHCEKRSDEAIHAPTSGQTDCFAEPVIGRARDPLARK